MILSFRDKTTEDIFNGEDTKAARKIPQNIWKSSYRKFDSLNAAHELKDLRIPPANKLEKLKGSLADFYSIRVNEQYRIIFKWIEGNAKEVQIIDYH